MKISLFLASALGLAFRFVSSKVIRVPPCVSIFVACVRQELITDIILLLIYMHLSLKESDKDVFFQFKNITLTS